MQLKCQKEKVPEFRVNYWFLSYLWKTIWLHIIVIIVESLPRIIDEWEAKQIIVEYGLQLLALYATLRNAIDSGMGV